MSTSVLVWSWGIKKTTRWSFIGTAGTFWLKFEPTLTNIRTRNLDRLASLGETLGRGGIPHSNPLPFCLLVSKLLNRCKPIFIPVFISQHNFSIFILQVS